MLKTRSRVSFKLAALAATLALAACANVKIPGMGSDKTASAAAPAAAPAGPKIGPGMNA